MERVICMSFQCSVLVPTISTKNTFLQGERKKVGNCEKKIQISYHGFYQVNFSRKYMEHIIISALSSHSLDGILMLISEKNKNFQ